MLLPSVRTYLEGIFARQWESLERGVPQTDGQHVPGVKQHNQEIVAAKNILKVDTVSLLPHSSH